VLIRKSYRLVAVAAAVALLASGCQTSGAEPTTASATGASNSATPAPTETAPDVALFESGPNSPIGYGLQVPDGATQLGPLTLIRSQRLIAAYAPDLQAAEAQKAADERAKLAEDQAEDPTAATPTPTPTPTPKPDVRPSDDSFNVLDQEPRPDTIISVMRIDENPTRVARRMLAQLTAMLPKSGVPSDLNSWCDSREQRVTGCRLGLSGTTADDRDVRIVLTIDPGNVTSRTAPPSSLRRPVMTIQIKYVGEPRLGQATRESSDIGDVAKIEKNADPGGLIWPSMDLDAPRRTPLVNGFVVPNNATILLSGFEPSFVELTTDRADTADELAESWVAERTEGEVAKDVAVELNEVSSTYTGSTGNGGPDDTFYRATHVLSARGNYILLMVYPPAYTS